MLKHYLLKLLMLFCLISVLPNLSRGQWVNINTQFGYWLSTHGYSQCVLNNNGWKLDTTCAAVVNAQSLTIWSGGIQSLSGIEYFDNLDTLRITQSSLQTIPTLPKRLKYFDCSSCYVSFIGFYHDSLRYFNCSNNPITYLSAVPESLQELDCSFNQSMHTIYSLPSSLVKLRCYITKLVNVPTLPATLQYIDLSANQYVVSLPALPPGLIQFNCSDCNITSMPTLPPTLQWFNCSGNELDSLPALPSPLTYLNCAYNDLMGLPQLPGLLDTLYCQGNVLQTLPSLPNSLKVLNCADNFYTQNMFTTLPPSLIWLACNSSYNNIHTPQTLPAFPSTLQYLDCASIFTSNLPTLPASLVYLNCSDNNLTSLPPLPAGLKYLYCSSNDLGNLPTLPSTLSALHCSNDLISTLPVLPPLLDTLVCSNNQLTSIPTLSSTLKKLDCNYNRLTGLPLLPSTLRYLDCIKNNLLSLPELPDTLQNLYCSYNPNLYCLPELKWINSLVFDSTAITCAPNYPVYLNNSWPVLGSLPLCDLFNSNGCPAYWKISGKVYNETNSNCQIDVNEEGLKNIPVRLYNNGVLVEQLNSMQGGGYSFKADFSTYNYTIDTSNIPFSIECPSAGFYTSALTQSDSLDTNMDFGIRCKPGYDLEARAIIGRFRPGFDGGLLVSVGDASSFYGAHCAAGVSGSVSLVYNGPVQYLGPVPGSTTPVVNGDTLTWYFQDMSTIDQSGGCNVLFHTLQSASLDSSVCFWLIVNPISGDVKPANNVLHRCIAVTGSFDPNEKVVQPSTANIDTSQEWLTYTIYFQNTGTDTAIRIYITDTLDNDLDPTTFQLLAYSHEPLVQIKDDALRFNFPNIYLPDSNINEPASHGFVQYRIKLKEGLPIGTNIENTAFIYFDFNEPVITNTTSSTVSVNINTGILKTGDTEIMKLYPNPASSNVYVVLSNYKPGARLVISSCTGSIVNETILTSASGQVVLPNCSSGVYFAKVELPDGSFSVQKLVINK